MYKILKLLCIYNCISRRQCFPLQNNYDRLHYCNKTTSLHSLAIYYLLCARPCFSLLSTSLWEEGMKENRQPAFRTLTVLLRCKTVMEKWHTVCSSTNPGSFSGAELSPPLSSSSSSLAFLTWSCSLSTSPSASHSHQTLSMPLRLWNMFTSIDLLHPSTASFKATSLAWSSIIPTVSDICGADIQRFC